MIGKRVGVYKLKEEIGRGGMGTVYLAERADGEFRQRVAIKLIKRGMDTDLILKRFRRERQIIASLDHPNIVHFLSGGSTDDGLPYLVMEYIEGKPLYKFCDENKLSIEERLNIFRQICDAVETAHQNKVIHRDLKPSNILVKPDGTPKLLDFGIAKVLDPDLAVTNIDPTATAMRVMTPEYASPEQVMDEEITPVSDVYSLGVVLYEILTGHRPYKLKRRVPFEVARVICEEEPSRPSAPNTDADMQIPTLEYISQSGNLAMEIESSKFKIQNLKFEELDRIVLKTLRKSPAERYDSAAALAEDIDNFLENRSVNAEVFSREYVNVEKMSDKKTVAILPFKIVGSETSENTEDIFLSVGLIDALISRLSGVQRLILRPTSTVLRFSELDDPFEVGNRLSVDFVVTGNIRHIGERLRVTAQLLDSVENATIWSASFDEKSADVLDLEDLLSEKIVNSLLPQLTGEERKNLDKRGTNSHEAYEAYLRGRAYWNMQTEDGFARAINFYRQAVEHDPSYALAYAAISEYYIFLGIHCVIPFEQGSVAAKQAAEQAVRLDSDLTEGHAALGFSALAFDLDWQKAFDRINHAIEINPNSLQAHFWHTAMLTQTAQFDSALDELKILNQLDPDSLLNLHMYAWIFYHARRYDESIGVYRQILKIEPNYTWGMLSYSWALRRIGEFEEAVKQAERAVQLTGKTPFYLTNLAATYAEAGNHGRTEETLTEILEIKENKFVSEYMLALIYCALGEKDKAFKNLEKSLATHDSWINWLGVEPQFDILRNDPRYDDLMRRAGNPLAKPVELKTDEKNEKKSVAVLPFEVIGENSDEGKYLSIGLPDAIITKLSNVRRLVVRPTSSILGFGTAYFNPFKAGSELNVESVVEGKIHRVGERIRISLKLLSITDNEVIWAEKMDEDFTDVLDLEDSISERVARTLLPKITGKEREQLQKRGTNNPAAYEAYMQARFYWNQFTPESFPKVIAALEKAVGIDPDYALAHAGIADFYNWASIYGLFRSDEVAPKVFAAAQLALEIDPTLGEAYATLGLYYSSQLDFEKSLKNYRRSIELAPNYSLAHEWYGSNLAGIGFFDESIKEVETAERLDPLSLRAKTLTAWTLYQVGRFGQAYHKAKDLISLEPNYPQGWLQAANSALELGFIKEAVEYCEKAVEMMKPSTLPTYVYCSALARDGQTEKARQVVDEMIEHSKNVYVMPYFLGLALVAVGEIDRAFEYFEKSYEERNHWLLWFGTEAKLDTIRTDERYFELFGRMNNPIIEKQRSDK